MGISQDFTLTPVHAHINLLGFVSLMLYGLYYRGAPTTGHLAWLQVAMAMLGVPLMAGGLASMLMGSHGGPGEFITIAGSLLTIGALGLFLVKLIRDAGRFRDQPQRPVAIGLARRRDGNRVIDPSAAAPRAAAAHFPRRTVKCPVNPL